MSLLARLFGRVRLTRVQEERLAAWRARAAADPKADLGQARILVVDLETTGLDMSRDRVLSIGAVAVAGGRIDIGSLFHRVLRQGQVLNRENVLVHGISPGLQEGGMEPADALLDFLELAGQDPVVAYHAPFDRTMLGNELARRLKQKLPTEWVDLAWVLPALFPRTVRHRAPLDRWIEHFHLAVPDRHRADVDALMTAELLLVALKAARSVKLPHFAALAALARGEAMLNSANGTGGF